MKNDISVMCSIIANIYVFGCYGHLDIIYICHMHDNVEMEVNEVLFIYLLNQAVKVTVYGIIELIETSL